MIVDWIVRLIDFIANLLILLVILQIVLSYFMDMYHPVRQFVERIVNPMLNPIRRSVPLIGMFDVSPMILILLIYGLQFALVNLLYTLR